jgi:hypothetical protein
MTKAEYQDYEERVTRFYDRHHIGHIVTRSEEPFFSWSPCECCARPLGGNRYYAECFIPPRWLGNSIEAEICTDCAYYAEYGQLDDMTMLEVNQ